MNQYNYQEANQITSQAIRDIEKRIKIAIENHTDFISLDGLNKTKLLNKINMIRHNDSVVHAIQSLSSNDVKAFNQSYQNALNQIDQTVEKQRQKLAGAHVTIEEAIDKIQLVVLKARESVLIGEKSKSKQYISEINSHADSQDTKRALSILKWQKPNMLSNAVRDSIIEIKQYVKKQQDEADKQAEKEQRIIAEAEKVVEQYTEDITALTRIVEKSDFLGKTNHKKMIIDQLNKLVRDEKLLHAVQELGWQKAKDHPRILKAVQKLTTQIKIETKKQIKQFQQEVALEESIENEEHPVEPIDLNQLYTNDDLAELRKIDQGYRNSIRLKLREQTQLKEIIDTEIDPQKAQPNPQFFNVNTSHIHQLKIPPEHSKLKNIPVEIEDIDGRVLVKVGPCDLSGVGGHHVREQIIKDVVNQALEKSNSKQKYEQVNVSAVTGVRGRLQMFQGFFFNTREQKGKHSNAYIKTDNESKLTHWEPRNGPQSFFNDTICAMAVAVSSSLFEHRVRQNTIHSSKDATQKILKSPGLKKAFDDLLSTVKDRVSNLINDIKKTFNISNRHQACENITKQYKKKIIERKNTSPQIEEDFTSHKP